MFEYTILSSQKHIDKKDFKLSSDNLGLPDDVPISIAQTELFGGKQEGSRLLVIQVGDIKVSVIPTRAMAIYYVFHGETRFGWHSPVKEIVHPSFINQEASGGIGWLDGFNEMLVRCGYAWSGHPGQDGDEFLTLHGRIQNTPADEITLTVEQEYPYKITLKGRVDEKRFKSTNFELHTSLSLQLDSPFIEIEDTLVNLSSYDTEYQCIYHNNFGPPILKSDGQVHIAASEVSPFNKYAGKGLATWQEIYAPEKDFDEMVYNMKPLNDDKGFGYALLENANKDQAVEVAFQTDNLPVFTLWKNLDTIDRGYVVGLEPGTSFAYNRAFQRSLGLVPTIKAKESKKFNLRFGFFTNEQQVTESRARINKLQTQQELKIVEEPLVKLD